MVKLKTDASFKRGAKYTGLGVQIVANKKSHEYCKKIKGIHTSVHAEIKAAIWGLKLVEEVHGADGPVYYFADSFSVIYLIERLWDGYEPRDKFEEELAKTIAHFDDLRVRWIPRKENKQADRLSRKALKK